MLQKSCDSPVWWRIRYGATRALESNTTSRVPTRRPEGGTKKKEERRSKRKTCFTKLLSPTADYWKDKVSRSVKSLLPEATTLVLTANLISPPSHIHRFSHFSAYLIRLTHMFAWMEYLCVSHRNLIHYTTPPSVCHLHVSRSAFPH